ncbi:FDXHR family putative zinc-binding protein [Brevibacterium casei]|uniref:FDXHR family putative zinc-binding protein n=1 Tax=Brevibacterium casei TaxID=33889 RepID=UPI00405684F1
MKPGQRVTVRGQAATVVSVRKHAPVATVEFEDGSRDLWWYGPEPSTPTQSNRSEPYAPETGDAGTSPHLVTVLASRPNSGNGYRCRDCGQSWTGFKVEHCPACHQSFGGTRAGDWHRVGSFSDPKDPRRCLNPTDAGLHLSIRKVWVRGFSTDTPETYRQSA